MANTEVAKKISNIAGAITDPIIVYPGGWGDTLPEWLKTAIITERMAMNVLELRGELKPEEITGTNAEACAYLYTAGLCFPFDHDWTNIFLYILGLVHSRHHDGAVVPEDIKVESLNDEQMRDLRRLKDFIYRKRTQARLDRERDERRQEREEAAARKKREQPTLFDFQERG